MKNPLKTMTHTLVGAALLLSTIACSQSSSQRKKQAISITFPTQSEKQQLPYSHFQLEDEDIQYSLFYLSLSVTGPEGYEERVMIQSGSELELEVPLGELEFEVGYVAIAHPSVMTLEDLFCDDHMDEGPQDDGGISDGPLEEGSYGLLGKVRSSRTRTKPIFTYLGVEEGSTEEHREDDVKVFSSYLKTTVDAADGEPISLALPSLTQSPFVPFAIQVLPDSMGQYNPTDIAYVDPISQLPISFPATCPDNSEDSSVIMDQIQADGRIVSDFPHFFNINTLPLRVYSDGNLVGEVDMNLKIPTTENILADNIFYMDLVNSELYIQGTSGDFDSDGVSNLDELSAGTNPVGGAVTLSGNANLHYDSGRNRMHLRIEDHAIFDVIRDLHCQIGDITFSCWGDETNPGFCPKFDPNGNCVTLTSGDVVELRVFGEDDYGYKALDEFLSYSHKEPPHITSSPPGKITMGEEYQYQISAYHSGGDAIAFSLQQGFPGLNLTDTGYLTFTILDPQEFGTDGIHFSYQVYEKDNPENAAYRNVRLYLDGQCDMRPEIGLWRPNDTNDYTLDNRIAEIAPFTGSELMGDNLRYDGGSSLPQHSVSNELYGNKLIYYFYRGPDGLSFNMISGLEGEGPQSPESLENYIIVAHNNRDDTIQVQDTNLYSMVNRTEGTDSDGSEITQYTNYFMHAKETEGLSIGPIFSPNFRVVAAVQASSTRPLTEIRVASAGSQSYSFAFDGTQDETFLFLAFEKATCHLKHEFQ